VNDALPPRFIGHNDKGKAIYESAAKWLARHRGIESMVFDPAQPQVVEDRVAREQGVIEHVGARMFNTYYPPTLKLGDSCAATLFVEHVRKLFPNEKEADHIFAWLAHRVQRPGEKVRHALLIGGPQGVGKDTIIDAVVPALGVWNTHSIAPDRIFSTFNEYMAKVLVRINEVADLHEVSKYKFYEATKNFIAGSPDWCEVNPKYACKYSVRNCAGVVLTTNSIDSGIYLPPDDRRHYAVETIELWGTAEERATYFETLWTWLYAGGFAHVAAWLHEYDLGTFNPNAPPPQTATFEKIVDNSKGSDTWLTTALERLAKREGYPALLDEQGIPKMVRADALRGEIDTEELTPQEISARLNAAMARAGYETYPCKTQPDRRHRLKTGDGSGGERERRVVVYAARSLPEGEREAILAQLPVPAF
jgi:hypothetical protein